MESLSSCAVILYHSSAESISAVSRSREHFSEFIEKSLLFWTPGFLDADPESLYKLIGDFFMIWRLIKDFSLISCLVQVLITI
jgi:hypothetical protein